MIISVEIMLRADPRVHVESIDQPGDPATWSADDMRQVLAQVLRAVSRVANPGAPEAPVQLRGMNWIVSPYESGVVLALEIHSASAVAGPFNGPAAALESLIVGALGSVPPGTVVH